MKRLPSCLVLATLFLSCAPAAEQRDAGTGDGPGSDAARNDLAATDQGPAGDAASADRSATDLGAGADSALADRPGTDARTCTPLRFDDCDGIAPGANSYTLQLAQRRVAGGIRSVSVGDSLAEVNAQMSGLGGAEASFNSFARIYCSEGLVFYFADNLAGQTTDEGALSNDDTLYKITAFGEFSGSTDSSPALSLGSAASELGSALGSADFTGVGSSVGGTSGEYRFYYAGHSAVLVDDAISSLSLFAPQAPSGTLDATLDFAAGTVGGLSVHHNVVGPLAVPSGATLTQLRNGFGSSPEAEGDMAVEISGNSVDVLVMSYSVLGLRFSGTATQYSNMVEVTGDDRKVFTAILSPPFQGRQGDVGIGASRAEVEALMGAPYASETDADGTTLHKHNVGSRKAGVIYAHDDACTERAVAFILNLIDLD